MGPYECPLFSSSEPIAVVGMACHLPSDIRSPAALWDHIAAKKTVPSANPEASKIRFNNAAHHSTNAARPGSVNSPGSGGYFLDSDIRLFDAETFGISPIEATWLDPQQRKVLEVCFEALEAAGVKLDAIAGSQTGVYVATFTSDFQALVSREDSFKHAYAATGVDLGIISNRVSNIFNLQGPSFTINTACSSSVYALHQACMALHAGDCESALVAGSNLILSVDQHMNTAKLGVLSSSGMSHTFDAAADGYCRAEAVGCLYITTLFNALQKNLPIRAVIRGTAVNTNGKTDLGITLPSGKGQERVIQKAYAQAGGLSPHQTGYFECHGTGTPVGDPIEVKSVSRAMEVVDRPASEKLIIGSVKPNVGHSEASSGITAIIKAVMAVEKGLIPPTAGIQKLNTNIPWGELNVRVATEVEPWPAYLSIRRASVNSFGYGGTNAHVIVEGLQSVLPIRIPNHLSPQKGVQNRLRVLTFSASSRTSLERSISRVLEHCSHSGIKTVDLAHTLASRKSSFAPPNRGFILATTKSIQESAPKELASNAVFGGSREPRKLLWVFTGQGAQWASMGKDLLTHFSEAVTLVRELDQVLSELGDRPQWSIETTLAQPSARISDPDRSQTCCTAVQLILVHILQSWGVFPTVVVGHSSGEIAAAYASGYISTKEAIICSYLRGSAVMQRNKPGAMIAVGMGAAGIRPYLVDIPDVEIACHNSPQSTTLSGSVLGIEGLQKTLKERGIFERRLETGNSAYHSSFMLECSQLYMQRMKETLGSGISNGARKTDSPTMISSVTGQPVEDGSIDPAYWCRNMTDPVIFDQAVSAAVDIWVCNEVIEIGPHSTLFGPLRQIFLEKQLHLSYHPTVVRTRGESQTLKHLLSLAGKLWMHAYPVNLDKINRTDREPCEMVLDLPPYPWAYEKLHWAETRMMREHRFWKYPRHDLLGTRIPGTIPDEPVWRNILRAKDVPWTAHHKVGPEPILPATGFWAMAIEALCQVVEGHDHPTSQFTLRNVSIVRPLTIPDNEEGIETLFSLHKPHADSPWYDFRAVSVTHDLPNIHCTGSIRLARSEAKIEPVPELRMKASSKYWYEAQGAVGFDYGPSFQLLSGIRTAPDQYAAKADVRVLEQAIPAINGESYYRIHPSTLDCMLQLTQIAIPAGKAEDMPWGYIPASVEEINIACRPKPGSEEYGEVYAYITGTVGGSARSRLANAQLAAPSVTVTLRGIELIAYEAGLPVAPEDSEKTESIPYWKETWVPDIDFSHIEAPLESQDTLPFIVDLALLKKPQTRLLCIMGDKAEFDVFRKTLMQYPQSYWDIVGLSEGQGHDNLTTTDLDQVAALTEPKYGIVILFGDTDLNIIEFSAVIIEGGYLVYRPDEMKPSIPPIGFTESLRTKDLVFARKSAVAENLTLHDQAISVYRNKMLKALDNGPCKLVHIPLSSVNKHSLDKRLVFLYLDGSSNLLEDMTAEELEDLQYMMRSNSRVIWITTGDLLGADGLDASLTTGLTRSLASENPSLELTVINISKDPTAADFRLVYEISLLKSKEMEYIIRGNAAYINRVVPLDLRPISFLPEDAHNNRFIPGTGQRLSLTWKKKGPELTTSFMNISRESRPPLAENEIEVEVKSFSITDQEARSLESASSAYSYHIGRQYSGIVRATGCSVTGLTAGDRVCGILREKQASPTIIRTDAIYSCRFDGFSFRGVACVPIAFTVGLHIIETVLRVQKGERVLVLPNTGRAGAIIIDLAGRVGAIVFAVATNETERKALDARGARVVQETDSYPSCDAIVAGEYNSSAEKAWSAIAPWGRFVALVGRPGKKGPADTKPFYTGASYGTVDLNEILSGSDFSMQRTFMRVQNLLGKQVTDPMPKVFKLADLTAALRSVSSSIADPGAVVTLEVESNVHIAPTQHSQSFSSEATYLLIGGFGGLGKMLIRWMANSGAKHLVVLSRTGPSNPEAKSLVAELSPHTQIQIVRGDATRKKDIKGAISHIPAEYPLRGVINAAMVLNDGMFDSMSLSAFNAALIPKLQSSRNLHEFFLEPSTLDFFIMTSSVSAIFGTPGQTNYSAGNAYMNALAQHRGRMGLPGVSVVLPMLLDMGVVADNPEIEADLSRKGLYGIQEAEILAAFESALNPPPNENLIIVGMDPSKLKLTQSSFWKDYHRLSGVVTRIYDGQAISKSNSQNIEEMSENEACSYLVERLSNLLARMLMVNEADVIAAPDKPIVKWGVDSMLAGELRTCVFKLSGRNMPIQTLLGNDMSVRKLAETLAKKC